MGYGRKLNIFRHKSACVMVTRGALKAERLVYVAVVNKGLSYPHGKSKIVYIGKTKKGLARIASSAAAKADDLLLDFGVNSLDLFVVTCSPRQNVKTWEKLEHGLIVAFKHMFGTPPKLNKHGVGWKSDDSQPYFTENALKSAIRAYS